MKKQLTQIQSRPFSRKPKTKAQDAKIVKASQAAFAVELAQLQAKAAAYEAATVTAPVAPVAAAPKYSIVNGLFVINN